ncbi:hypothetical protein [Flocculibacter collagenilyticus]|uniref:hypothetical protein n=1 Tax=Flocculibacter collagenilyticus TaxID=2744479 RepID=UPI0018F3C03E|nr:hypothetical protein [Flocculibacter collagenilyticus]
MSQLETYELLIYAFLFTNVLYCVLYFLKIKNYIYGQSPEFRSNYIPLRMRTIIDEGMCKVLFKGNLKFVSDEYEIKVTVDDTSSAAKSSILPTSSAASLKNNDRFCYEFSLSSPESIGGEISYETWTNVASFPFNELMQTKDNLSVLTFNVLFLAKNQRVARRKKRLKIFELNYEIATDWKKFISL